MNRPISSFLFFLHFTPFFSLFDTTMFNKLFGRAKPKKTIEDEESVLPDEHSSTDQSNHTPIKEEDLKFYQGGVRERYKPIVKWVGRIGFIAKGVVYGCIGVLTLTNLSGAHTPNGSEGNESPQGAFLLLGGIPSVGKPILVVMAIGLCLYIIWR